MADLFSKRAKNWDNPFHIRMTTAFVDRVKEKKYISKGDKIADVGCGTGLVGFAFTDIAQCLYMVDTSEGMMQVLNEKIEYLKIDNANLVHGEISQLTERVDVCLVFMALHHIEKISTFLEQIYDRLSDHGRLIIGDLYPDEGRFHTNIKVPHNGFDTENLAEVMMRVGFKHTDSEPLMKVERNNEMYGLFILAAEK